MTEIEVTCHAMPEWPSAYRVYLSSGGQLLGCGRNVAQVAAQRLSEEGLAHSGSRIVVRYADGKFGEQITVSDAVAGKLPERCLSAGETAFLVALRSAADDLESRVHDAELNRRGLRIEPTEIRGIAAQIRELLKRLGAT